MDSYGGRPHWGKMHYLNAAQLCEYPRWGEFQELRAALDPDGTFRSEYVDRVLGVPNASDRRGARWSRFSRGGTPTNLNL